MKKVQLLDQHAFEYEWNQYVVDGYGDEDQPLEQYIPLPHPLDDEGV